MERVVTNALFYYGAFIVVSSGNILKLKEDCFASKATLLVSVPRVFNRIVDGVNLTLNSMVTDESKRAMIEPMVFQKVRESFGGQIKQMASGSAPLNASVQAMMQKIMGCKLV